MSEWLTTQVKARAFELGADLVGVGNIERWEQAPPLMSPAGILPTAKSVVVCALHHVDGMIEVGGEKSPHEMGSYGFQTCMNHMLDALSYRIALTLEDLGYDAVPITASNIWRYRPYKELDAIFSPDVSHIYGAVAAGLAEMGLNGLALTPEFGPRNRFVSIITDAPLTPTPLLPGDTLCDRCGECVRHCPTDAFRKETDGETALVIEGKRYPFKKKNLWRCAWGEHFGLDVGLPIPDVVDEAVILENVKEHGLRGGTMGSCLKFCLPAHLRQWDKDYSTAPRRRRETTPAAARPPRRVEERLLAHVLEWGGETALVASREEWLEKGVELRDYLPDAESVVLIGVRTPNEGKPAGEGRFDAARASGHIARSVAWRVAREIEDMGYSAAPYGTAPDDPLARELSARFGGKPFIATFVVTSASLTPRERVFVAKDEKRPEDLTGALKRLAVECGADLVGVSSAARLTDVAERLRPIFEGETILDGRDTASMWWRYEPEVEARERHVLTPEDHLPGAKSVLVFGLRLPRATARRAFEPPAEAVGPYAYAEAEAPKLLGLMATELWRRLVGWGYRAVVLQDVCGTGSLAANPRGGQPNGFCNRFAAVCAGLGTLGKGGFVLTERFGPNARFFAIVTDAPLAEDAFADVSGLRSRCDAGCRACMDACTVGAFRSSARVAFNGAEVKFSPLDQKRCDWALRYGLVPEEGVRYTGSTTDAPPPEEITAEALADGLRRQDAILKIRPCVAERCALACPYALEGARHRQ